ncbi:hypothetical protein, partial [Streptococcus phage phi-SsuYTJ2_rum]
MLSLLDKTVRTAK